MHYTLPALRALLLVLALQPIYLLSLMALDYVAPADRRAAHIAASFETGYVLPITGSWDVECIAQSIGLESNVTPLRNAVLAARPLYGPTVCDALAAVVAHKPEVSWLPYFRYWHGYRVILDPLTAWLPIKFARYAFFVMLTAAFLFFALESVRLIGWTAALALSWPIVVMTDISRMWVIMPHALATICIFAGSAWFARKIRLKASVGVLIATAAALGSVFNFVDFLTNPPWQPMLLAFFVLASGNGARQDWLKCGMVLAAWSGGYALTWASKWIIAALVAPDGLAVLRDVAEVAQYRINGDYLPMVVHYFLAPTIRVLSFTFRHHWQLALIVVVAALTPILFRKVDVRQFAILSVPALIPFLWFELMSNHTQIHFTFSYRPVASSIGILLAAWVLASSAKSYEQKYSHSRR